MKHKHLVLTAIALILGVILFGCKKEQQEPLTPKITNEKVEATATTATFTWTVDWPGKLMSVVEVSENEDMSGSRYYGSEEETENHDFTANVSGLKKGMMYYYRFVVWNRNFVNNKFLMEEEIFFTEARKPYVKTVEVAEVTRSSAKVICEVTDDCGAEVTERGVYWGTSEFLSEYDSLVMEGSGGVGTYSVVLTNLNPEQTYFVCSYATNSQGTALGNVFSFVTGDVAKPAVVTAEVTNIDWRTATGGGEVTDNGNATVAERGICWSTSHNPEMSDSYAVDETGTDVFTVDMDGLIAGTVYYVRAYAKNQAGVGYGNEVSFTAKAPEMPSVTTSPVTMSFFGGGEVTFDGGADVTERGVCWSMSQHPTINGSHASKGFGMGSYIVIMTELAANTTYYVRAYATNSAGTAYGEDESFTTGTSLQPPTGAINGVFSVGPTRQVWFSQGNLQYQASSDTWHFADNQWDYIGTQTPDSQGNMGGTINGSDNADISQSYEGWIDLFGWGTSGHDHGANCYQPWSTSASDNDYLAYGNGADSLNSGSGEADWGYNAISNGGDQPQQWRTLTKNEWDYVFNTRETPSGARYAKALVNGVNGVILLPDDWDENIYSLIGINKNSINFSANIINATNWENTFQSQGAVFLPAAGYRVENGIKYVNREVYYYSASVSSTLSSYSNQFLVFVLSSTSTSREYRYYGCSVRLAQDIEQ